ncbi:MAG: hypothetical protein DCF21_02780 [Leptolyngbya sp.]|nr:MAG: hypothetical protein DCF21_02780 [Leptolyngbya sp.]
MSRNENRPKPPGTYFCQIQEPGIAVASPRSKLRGEIAKQLCQFNDQRTAISDQRAQQAKQLCQFAIQLCQFNDQRAAINDQRAQ